MIPRYLARRGLRLTILGDFYLTTLGLAAMFGLGWAIIWVMS